MFPIYNESPFVRLIIPLLFGILLYIFFPTNHFFTSSLLCIFFIVCIVFFRLLKDYVQFKYAFIKGIFIHLFIISFAYSISVFQNINSSSYWYKKKLADKCYAIATLQSNIETKPKSYKATVEISNICTEKENVKTIGKAILYFEKNEQSHSLKMGDKIIFQNRCKDIKNTGNPGAFDYASYSKYKNIFQTAYLTSSQWKKLNIQENNWQIFFANINNHTRVTLKKYLPDSTTYGIAQALLIGYRGDIDNETYQSYINTGIVHIIAISGLHIGILYGITYWVLLLFPYFKKRKNIALILVLVLLWVFATIIGFPASVVRATLMFTLIGIGEMQHKKISIYNSLAASAFCMLCYNPMWIMDVGFQLSYLAVLSIVIFYKHIYSSIYVSNKYFAFIWKIISGSLAAQILTFPICIYYFHQFPLLFLLSNLLAIPFVSFALYAELLLVLVQSISPIAKVLGMFISHLIYYFSKIIFAISQLHFATITNIQISTIQMILLFLFISFFSYFIFQKKVKILLASLLFLLLFFVNSTINIFKIFHQQKIIIYNIPNTKSIEFVYHNSYCNHDSDLISANVNNEKYVLNPSHNYLGLKQKNAQLYYFISKSGIELFSFGNKKIMRIDHTNFHTKYPINIDILVLSKKCTIRSEWLTQNLKPACIILDSSIPFWQIDKIKHALSNLQIPLFIVAEMGAYISYVK